MLVAKLSTTSRNSRKCAAVSSLIGMILCWMMLRIKCIPETFSAEIEYVTIQTELSKKKAGSEIPGYSFLFWSQCEFSIG